MGFILTGDYVHNPEYTLERCKGLIALSNLLIGRDPAVIGIYGSVPVCFLDPNEDGQGCKRQIFEFDYRNEKREKVLYYVADFGTDYLGVPSEYRGMGEYRIHI